MCVALLLHPTDRIVGTGQNGLTDGFLKLDTGFGFDQHSQAILADHKNLWADVPADGVSGTGQTVKSYTHTESFAREVNVLHPTLEITA